MGHVEKQRPSGVRRWVIIAFVIVQFGVPTLAVLGVRVLPFDWRMLDRGPCDTELSSRC